VDSLGADSIPRTRSKPRDGFSTIVGATEKRMQDDCHDDPGRHPLVKPMDVDAKPPRDCLEAAQCQELHGHGRQRDRTGGHARLAPGIRGGHARRDGERHRPEHHHKVARRNVPAR
jgi:hypothetical protein